MLKTSLRPPSQNLHLQRMMRPNICPHPWSSRLFRTLSLVGHRRKAQLLKFGHLLRMTNFYGAVTYVGVLVGTSRQGGLLHSSRIYVRCSMLSRSSNSDSLSKRLQTLIQPIMHALAASFFMPYKMLYCMRAHVLVPAFCPKPWLYLHLQRPLRLGN